MLKNNYITAADRAAAQFPTPIPLEDSKQQAGAPPAFVVQQVKDELAAHDIPEDRYYSGGFQVQTTIDPKAQQAAEQAATEAMKGQVDDNLLNALVAVDPKTGGVLAYYGGKPIVQVNGQDQAGRDWADTPQNPGSSMKPFDLTAFLKMGKGLDATFDGSNNRTFDGRVVRNAGPGSSCSQQCTVAEAMNARRTRCSTTWSSTRRTGAGQGRGAGSRREDQERRRRPVDHLDQGQQHLPRRWRNPDHAAGHGFGVRDVRGQRPAARPPLRAEGDQRPERGRVRSADRRKSAFDSDSDKSRRSPGTSPKR